MEIFVLFAAFFALVLIGAPIAVALGGSVVWHPQEHPPPS